MTKRRMAAPAGLLLGYVAYQITDLLSRTTDSLIPLIVGAATTIAVFLLALGE